MTVLVLVLEDAVTGGAGDEVVVEALVDFMSAIRSAMVMLLLFTTPSEEELLVAGGGVETVTGSTTFAEVFSLADDLMLLTFLSAGRGETTEAEGAGDEGTEDAALLLAFMRAMRSAIVNDLRRPELSPLSLPSSSLLLEEWLGTEGDGVTDDSSVEVLFEFNAAMRSLMVDIGNCFKASRSKHSCVSFIFSRFPTQQQTNSKHICSLQTTDNRQSRGLELLRMLCLDVDEKMS